MRIPLLSLIINNVRKLFRLKRENEAIEDRITRDIKNLFEQEEENNYKPVGVANVYCNNYIEYGSNGDRDKTLSIKEYLDETKPYLKDMKLSMKFLNHLFLDVK